MDTGGCMMRDFKQTFFAFNQVNLELKYLLTSCFYIINPENI